MRIVFIVLLFISFTSTCAAGDSLQVKSLRNTVYFNPLSAGAGTINISYERFLNRKFSLRIAAIKGQILPQGKSFESTRKFEFTGGTLELRSYTRIYPGRTTEDFYFGPYLQYFDDHILDLAFEKNAGFVLDEKGNTIPISSSFSVLKGGIMAGSRQVFFKRLSVDLQAGIHFQSPSKSTPVSSEIISLMTKQGVSFRIGLNLGYCF